MEPEELGQVDAPPEVRRDGVTKYKDPDIRAIKAACKALDRSSSRLMLKAIIAFLLDYYIYHPSPNIPSRLKKN